MGDQGGSAADGRAFAAAHDALLRHSDIQFGFPKYETPPVPQWLGWLIQFVASHWTPIKWTLLAAAALIAVFVLYSLVRQFWYPFWRSDAEAPRREWPREEPWRPTQAAARRLLQDADALAAAGRHAEAVHLLLLRSIEDIAERRPRLLRPTFTSREIGALTELPAAARPAFHGIARMVERARFADLPIGADEFARCRADYESFAFPAAWQAAA